MEIPKIKINWNRHAQYYEENVTKLAYLSGYDIEELVRLFAAGYTLQPPNYTGSFEELAREINNAR